MVITDLEMPQMDGIELTNEIRRIYTREQLAVIGISGASNGIHSARFIKNGADDISPELLAIARKVVSMKNKKG